jgi:hypothetical protein
MLHLFLITFTAVSSQAAPQLGAVFMRDHSAAMLLIAALFYFGFKWRAK